MQRPRPGRTKAHQRDVLEQIVAPPSQADQAQHIVGLQM